MNSVEVHLRIDYLQADNALPGNPCACGGIGSHNTMLLLPPRSAIENGPQDVTALLRPNHYAQPTMTCPLACIQSIGTFL